MKVKTINEQEVKVLIKKCPIEVQKYISSLEELIKIKEYTNKKCIKKIKELSNEKKHYRRS